MKPIFALALLVGVFAASTALLGWWAVPIVAAILGLARRPDRMAGPFAALGASLAWAALLIVASLDGAVGEVAVKLGGVLGLPGIVLILLTLVFPALLAVSAAELTRALRGLFTS